METARVDVRLRRGSTWGMGLTWTADDEVTPINLTGYTFALMVKRDPDDVAEDAVVSLSVGAGITVDAPAGGVQWTVPAGTTAALEVGRYWWDLRVTSGGGEVYYPVAGEWSLERSVTRDA